MAALTIARLELFRLFGTKRGWVTMIALLLVWLMIMRYVIYPASDLISSNETASIAGVVLDKGIGVIQTKYTNGYLSEQSNWTLYKR